MESAQGFLELSFSTSRPSFQKNLNSKGSGAGYLNQEVLNDNSKNPCLPPHKYPLQAWPINVGFQCRYKQSISYRVVLPCRRSDAESRQINDNFSTLLKLTRSLSAPVDLSHFSLLVNASCTLSTDPQQSRDDIRYVEVRPDFYRPIYTTQFLRTTVTCNLLTT
jgi:hypothetical protein